MTRYLSPAIFLLSALPAVAQDGGLTYSGEAKLEYLSASPDAFVLRGEIGTSWRSGGLLGFDASIDSLLIDDGSDFTNVWGAAVLSMGSGEVAVGAPRPMVDVLRVAPRFSSSRLLDLETSFLNGPLTSVASSGDNGMTPGITYRHDAGSLTFGAGYHHLNDGSSFDVAEGIMRYEGDMTSLFISAEYGHTSGDDLLLMQIGGLYDADRFDAGATFSKLRSSGSVHTLRLYGSVDVGTSLAVSGDLLMVEDAHDIYSLSATYNMDSGLFVEGGGTVLNGSEEVFDIGVGFKF